MKHYSMASSCEIESLWPEGPAPPATFFTAATATVPATTTVPVLHVINGEHYAGAERVQDLLAGGLAPLGFNVTQACLKPGRFAAMRQNRSVPLVDVPMRNRFDPRPALKLARLVRAGGFRLIHSHSVRAALVAGLASKLTGVPMIHHLHSPTNRDSTRLWQDRMNAWAERLGLWRASALIAVSASLGEYARRQGYAAEKVVVIPNGVPARRPIPVRDGAKTTWTLGMIALFRPRKGIEVLLHAMALLRSQGMAVRLRAVGDFETASYGHGVQHLASTRTDRRDRLDRLPTGRGRPVGPNGPARAAQPFRRGPADGAVGGDVGRPAGGGHGRGRNPRGGPRRPGRSFWFRRAIRGCLPRRSGGSWAARLDWHALHAACRARHSERFSDVRMAAEVAAVYRRVLAEWK